MLKLKPKIWDFIVAFDQLEAIVEQYLKASAIPYATLADLTVQERYALLSEINKQLGIDFSDSLKESLINDHSLSIETITERFKFCEQL